MKNYKNKFTITRKVSILYSAEKILSSNEDENIFKNNKGKKKILPLSYIHRKTNPVKIKPLHAKV